ncbi:hypothetical protein EVA_12999 [gut metagenome]|uniref:Uncharacterized protein n=1 Tax=gut metagenome TaxID=749906 RepID=J9FV76_9ZZZZ
MTCSISLSSVLVTVPWLPFQISSTRFFRKPVFSTFNSCLLMRKGFIVIGHSSV